VGFGEAKTSAVVAVVVALTIGGGKAPWEWDAPDVVGGCPTQKSKTGTAENKTHTWKGERHARL
jgi:hypothetical protein